MLKNYRNVYGVVLHLCILIVGRYESKGKQWATPKAVTPLGLHPDDVERTMMKIKQGSSPEFEESVSKSAKKKAKKKASKENKMEKELSERLERVLGSDTASPSKSNAGKNIIPPEGGGNQATASDPAKRLKNLKKKLRDIEVLAQKIESGELKNPEAAQLEKVSRRSEIESELSDLEAELESS